MVERHHRFDARIKQRVYQVVVMINPELIDSFVGSIGKDPSPRQREAILMHSKCFHHVHVFINLTQTKQS